MNINFIIQCDKILSQNNCTEDELRMIYDYVLFLDNETLISYFMKKTILGYENDLYIYLDVVRRSIKLYESMEEYEKCYKLKNKEDETLKIINNINN